jgi:hypothetical protein
MKLPNDPSIDRLTDAERTAAAATWVGRACGEASAVGQFAQVVRSLELLGGAPAVLALARRAVDDEQRHATLCHRVAERFAGRALAMPPALAAAPPAYQGADERLAASLYVIEMCAVNETTAAAFLQATLAAARAPLARAALRALLGDEIEHGRIGWAHLSWGGSPLARAVAPWVPALIRSNLRAWSDRPEFASSGRLAEHGCLSSARVIEVAHQAARELIEPGFARLGAA